jgi:hypothetical protein
MRALAALFAVFLCTAGAGCVTGRGMLSDNQACNNCNGAGCHGCSIFGGGLASHHADPGIGAGPPTAQVAYPYYTVRGPRDFLLDDPPSLGP